VSSSRTPLIADPLGSARSVREPSSPRTETDELDLFEYILIITSVIFAMAVAQILSGVSRLAQSSATVKPYFAHTAWVVVLFVFIFLNWWVSWEFRSADWTVLRYAYMLIFPTSIFFACSLLVPSHLDERLVDLEAHFFQVRRPLFLSFTLASTAAFLDGSFLAGETLLHPVRIPQAAFLGASMWAMFTTNRRAHNVIVSAVLMMMLVGISTRFWMPR